MQSQNPGYNAFKRESVVFDDLVVDEGDGIVLYKTKTQAKFVENRKCYRSPLLLQARIMFDLFSSDFKTILKGSSVLGLRSSFCTYSFFMTSSKIC